VTFERETGRAKGIGPGVDAAVGEKALVVASANGTFDITAGVKQSKHFQAYSTEKLQVLTGHKANNKRDKSLHQKRRVSSDIWPFTPRRKYIDIVKTIFRDRSSLYRVTSLFELNQTVFCGQNLT
jgi:hypothetical protein